jgi:hypothetical protein
MSALESPFEAWGLPKAGKSPADVAAWIVAQPDFHDNAPGYVGSAISAQRDWMQNGGGQAMAGFIF